VLFVVVPIVELYVIVQVAGGIGVLQTLGLLVVVSIVGAWLVKAEGLGLIRRVQLKLASGEMPGKELVDGALILFAGALMLTPGFVTDTFGLVLLLPPTRAVARAAVLRRYAGKLEAYGVHDGAKVTDTFFAYRDRSGDVIDMDDMGGMDDMGDYVDRSGRSPSADPRFELGP